jgi:hypothetical protein
MEREADRDERAARKLDELSRWRSSMVEQLICNQQVAGSSPIASSTAYSVAEQHRAFFRDGFPSGQREQTVNLSPLASKVRILPRPQINLGNGNEEFAGVAQLVELQPSKLDVAGSRPVSRSVNTAHVAQLAEHVLGKDEVTRSIRVVGSRPKQQQVVFRIS